MRITKSRLREIIKEEIAINIAAEQEKVRGAQDAAGLELSFEDWANEIVKLSGIESFNDLRQDINYYDAWLAGTPPESMVGVI